jgi:hypothetical protein
MDILELIKIGQEVGIVFPEELSAKLQLALGDDVHITPTANGFSLHSNQSNTKLFYKLRAQAIPAQSSVD